MNDAEQQKFYGLTVMEIDFTHSFIESLVQSSKLAGVNLDVWYERDNIVRTKERPFGTTIVVKPNTQPRGLSPFECAKFVMLTYKILVPTLVPRPLVPLWHIGFCFKIHNGPDFVPIETLLLS